ncbi:hypothetical protein LXA43DRAFT_1097916 [Ganoderma leucocontextum]|nr:hypothetical protein LXA43DRAFT_1097916 [Ganoderma leucocontextum]
MSSAAATKRTRSQTTLHTFFPTRLDLAASPLKQARNALKHPPPADPHPSPPPLLPELDPATTTPSPDNALKRPSSPAKDAALLLERDFKRLRHEALFPKPSLPLTSSSDPSLPASPDRRAKSVPPRPLSPPSDSPVPLLDLNNVPSSPRRSPTKFRIASLPPQSPGKHLHPHLPHRPSSFPHAPPKSPSTFFLQSTPLPLISDPNLPPDASTALPPPTTPMSPLTPLPQDDSFLIHPAPDLDATPVPKPIPTLLFSIDPLPGPSTLPPPPDVPSPSATPTRPPPHLPPLVPSSTEQTQPESMLPRPSGVKARMKPKVKLAPDIPNKKVKNPRNKKPITLGLPQIRNTRSTRAHRENSLPPQKQAEEVEQIEQAEEDVNDAFTDICASSVFPSSHTASSCYPTILIPSCLSSNHYPISPPYNLRLLSVLTNMPASPDSVKSTTHFTTIKYPVHIYPTLSIPTAVIVLSTYLTTL